jgi:hypothetical protein
LKVCARQTPIGDVTGNGRWIFYATILIVLGRRDPSVATARAILAGIVAFGVVVHGIVAVATERGTDWLAQLRS